MKHELFTEQPGLELLEGIRVCADTALRFEAEGVSQRLEKLVLETERQESGTNGFNAYKCSTHLTLSLNPGDILLFHPQRGYYLPAFPVASVDDAIAAVQSLGLVPHFKEVNHVSSQ